MRRFAAITLLAAGAFAQAVQADQKTDDRIYDQVRMRLTTDADVKGGGFDVSVKDAVVTLKGRVDTEKGKNRATKLSKKVKGVKEARQPIDGWTADSIRHVLPLCCERIDPGSAERELSSRRGLAS